MRNFWRKQNPLAISSANCNTHLVNVAQKTYIVLDTCHNQSQCKGTNTSAAPPSFTTQRLLLLLLQLEPKNAHYLLRTTLQHTSCYMFRSALVRHQ